MAIEPHLRSRQSTLRAERRARASGDWTPVCQTITRRTGYALLPGRHRGCPDPLADWRIARADRGGVAQCCFRCCRRSRPFQSDGRNGSVAHRTEEYSMPPRELIAVTNASSAPTRSDRVNRALFSRIGKGYLYRRLLFTFLSRDLPCPSRHCKRLDGFELSIRQRVPTDPLLDHWMMVLL
jgi:hypothetical protein